uniref:Uncharacterized protein n=1 Tax=Rhizophora mucronata TaxID=61149 RepID=A0A2P2JGP9_RHIMU
MLGQLIGSCLSNPRFFPREKRCKCNEGHSLEKEWQKLLITQS